MSGEINSVDFCKIGNKIKKRRKSLGLSQEQLAELIGVTPSYIGHIERSSRNLSLNTAIGISRALGISLDYLLLDEKNESSSEGVLCDIAGELKNHSLQQTERFLNAVRILADNIDDL